MKAQTRGRPRANEPKLSPDHILDAALALLAESGLGALTMRALARRPSARAAEKPGAGG